MNDFTLEQIAEGQSASFEVTVTETMMESFLAVCGDDNPLHVDAAWARAHGLRDRVVWGLLTSSFYSRLVGVHLPGKRCLLQTIDVKFLKPVYAGESLVVRGEVAHKSEAVRQLEIRASIARTDGTEVSRAKLKVGVLE